MSDQNEGVSRRRFIRRSIFAVSSIAAGAASYRGGSASAQDHDYDLDSDFLSEYPWNLEIGNQARATLYLLGNSSINRVVYKKLSATLFSMHHRAEVLMKEPDGAKSDAYNKLAQAISPKTVKELVAALKAAEIAVTAYGDETYQWYTTAAPDSIHADIRKALDDLDKIIMVPMLIRAAEVAHKKKAKNYFNTDDDEHHRFGDRRLHELFTQPDWVISRNGRRKSEREQWKDARDAGVLWCAPIALFEKDDAVFLEERRKRIPNGSICDGGVCVPRDGAYCQMVDGTCNTMSNP